MTTTQPANRTAVTIMTRTNNMAPKATCMIDYLAIGTGARPSVCPQNIQY
jgi:hypothetical protein